MKSNPEQPLIITKTTSSPDVTRRHFVKRTGTATVATAFALNSLHRQAEAQAPGSPNWVVELLKPTFATGTDPMVIFPLTTTKRGNAGSYHGATPELTVTATPEPHTYQRTTVPNGTKHYLYSTQAVTFDIVVRSISGTNVTKKTYTFSASWSVTIDTLGTTLSCTIDPSNDLFPDGEIQNDDNGLIQLVLAGDRDEGANLNATVSPSLDCTATIRNSSGAVLVQVDLSFSLTYQALNEN